MKAVFITEHGGPEVLRYEELPDPEPKPGEVRVRVKAVSMNHLDLWVRRGNIKLKWTYPFILGCDVAGVVDQAGPGTEDDLATPGREVILSAGVSCNVCEACLAGRDNYCRKYGLLGEHLNGGECDLICVPRQNLIPKPKNLDFIQASCLPVTFLTAWQMVDRAGVRPGSTVLVQAGGSGVGVAAIQYCKVLGATVFATAGSDEKAKQCEQLGADAGINYNTTDFAARCKELTGKKGVDIVLDSVGASVWEPSLKALAWGGKLVTCGATAGFEATTDLRHVFFRQIQILGSTMGSKSALHEIVRWVEAGRVKPVIAKTFPVTEVREAHKFLESRSAFGKVVLVM